MKDKVGKVCDLYDFGGLDFNFLWEDFRLHHHAAMSQLIPSQFYIPIGSVTIPKDILSQILQDHTTIDEYGATALPATIGNNLCSPLLYLFVLHCFHCCHYLLVLISHICLICVLSDLIILPVIDVFQSLVGQVSCGQKQESVHACLSGFVRYVSVWFQRSY